MIVKRMLIKIDLDDQFWGEIFFYSITISTKALQKALLFKFYFESDFFLH